MLDPNECKNAQPWTEHVLDKRERMPTESWEDYIKRLHADGLVDESDYAEQEEPCREGGQPYDPKRDGYGRFRKSKYHAPKGLRKTKAKLKKAAQKRNRR